LLYSMGVGLVFKAHIKRPSAYGRDRGQQIMLQVFYSSW